MKHLKCILLLIVFWQLHTSASNNNLPLGARSAALGGASVTLNDLWSTQNNQAGLARIDTIEIGVYAERKYVSVTLS